MHRALCQRQIRQKVGVGPCLFVTYIQRGEGGIMQDPRESPAMAVHSTQRPREAV